MLVDIADVQMRLVLTHLRREKKENDDYAMKDKVFLEVLQEANKTRNYKI